MGSASAVLACVGGVPGRSREECSLRGVRRHGGGLGPNSTVRCPSEPPEPKGDLLRSSVCIELRSGGVGFLELPSSGTRRYRFASIWSSRLASAFDAGRAGGSDNDRTNAGARDSPSDPIELLASTSLSSKSTGILPDVSAAASAGMVTDAVATDPAPRLEPAHSDVERKASSQASVRW